jgi:hypothetical protein
MSVKYGQPYLPKLSEYEIKLGHDLPRIFKDISKEKADLLISLIRSAEREKHGTMLVFTAHAKKEADRLKAQGTEIEPQLLTPVLLSHLTPIDGAIIIDPNGVCHAIGVILDGLASDGVGDPSRGARYNSALRYVASSAFPCLAVVISEDGGVDLVPNMKPAIRRNLLEEMVREITTLAEANKIERRRYIELINWLSDHRFYLLEEHCEVVNHSMQVIEDRLAREEPTVIRIMRTLFKANSEMDENLYYIAE